MKILQLCHKPPFPPVDGGAIAMNNITQGLLKMGHEVKVITVSTKKHPLDLSSLSEDYKSSTLIEGVYIDTAVKRKDAFFNLFNKRSYNIERFICKELGDKIEFTLKSNSFDLVIIEGLFVAPYFKAIRENFEGKIVLRTHNVEFKIWERMGANASNPIKKNYLKLLAKRLKEFEVKTFNRVDAICAMTSIDSGVIGQLCNGVPIGTFPSGYLLQEENGEFNDVKEEKALFHIASMDWQPNQEAVDWFLNKVWPLVISKNKEAKIYLAGREMPTRYKELKMLGVHIVGEVAVAREFYASKKIMVVPLLSGSGMRIKIIEGMAMGKTIVSTSVGAEGIQVTHEKNILIADTAEHFANQILRVLEDDDYCTELSKNARELIANEYNNDVVCDKFMQFVERL
ncbi:MAG: glycosyltransferase involved in cell wall biosynthesis [Saprospiraceae bacterium]|jgi:glycosyltransferase involved in cell wall biosynthesis